MAKSERKKPHEPTSHPVTIDAWTLKCLYRLSDYRARIADGRFVELYRTESHRRGERPVEAYYGRGDDRLARVRLQWFENEAGEITRSGMKEPKWMELDGSSYHLHGGDCWWQRLRRDLTNFRYNTTDPHLIAVKKKYADWRRFKCNKFGPVEAVWRRQWFRSRQYHAYCVCREGAERYLIRLRRALKPLRSFVLRLFSAPKGRVLALA